MHVIGYFASVTILCGFIGHVASVTILCGFIGHVASVTIICGFIGHVAAGTRTEYEVYQDYREFSGQPIEQTKVQDIFYFEHIAVKPGLTLGPIIY